MASPILTNLGGAAVNTVGQTVAFAGGTTASHALTPYGTAISQEAFKIAPIRVVDALLLSVGVAQGQIDPDKAATWATASGFNADAFAAMIEIANTGPALGSALELLRRGDWTETQFRTALHRQGIEREWWDGLTSLQHDRLDLGAVATAVHRGIMDDSGLLVTPVPAGTGHVPRIPVSPLDTLAEFAAHGIDPERARVLVADTGLPLSLGEMLSLLNRGVVTETDVKVSIAESNVRNEYMDVALKLARRLLTPHEYAEAELRGILTHEEAQAGAALSGIEPADYRTQFGIMGRPLAEHQITTGLARGGTYGGTYDDVPEGPFRDAIRRSAIRPEYASLAYANRYTYPSAFVLRSLAQAGDLGNEAAVAKVLEEIGWKPSFADQVAAAWMGGSSTDKHVSGAETRLVTATHKSYIDYEISDATATTALEAAGVGAGSAPAVLALWQAERDLVRKSLSAAQVKKAWVEQVVNPATGVAWTKQDATTRLLELGYAPADAETFLDL
jgi:hypothetical protein